MNPDLPDCDDDSDVCAYDVLRTAGFDHVTAKKITLHYLLTRAAADLQDLQAAAMECGYSLPAASLIQHDS